MEHVIGRGIFYVIIGSLCFGYQTLGLIGGALLIIEGICVIVLDALYKDDNTVNLPRPMSGEM
jgi:hypothetical protein